MEEHIPKIEELDERSEPVREILGTPPSWTVRWGITVILLFVLVLMGFSWLIKFPEVIPASVVLTTPQPPVSIIARSSGTLDQLLVKDGQLVEAGQLLAILENPAHSQAVLWLEQWLIDKKDSFASSYTYLPPFHNRSTPQLGSLQDRFTTFDQAAQNYQFLLSQDPSRKEIQATLRQIHSLKVLQERQQQQSISHAQQLSLAQTDLDRHQHLFKDKVISAKALEDKNRAYLQDRSRYEESKLQLAQIDVDISALNRTITQLQNQQALQYHQQLTQLQSASEQLLAAISQWRESYLFIAPVAGTITFFQFWSEQQFVTNGEEVMILLPNSGQEVIGKVMMPIRQSGKVEVGQKVQIQLDNFPFDEYGMLIGEIQLISSVPRNGQYAIEIALPEGLNTSFNREIPFRQEMAGKANIITEELRLIERIFYRLRSIFHQP
ncbi:MAG: HlyD family efflux transporter periplasmic adaptor subunit [Bacteroidota bacterium]